MIFPIGDENIIGGCKPHLSHAFIGINVLIFILQLNIDGNLICQYATIPNYIAEGRELSTLITNTFMHGGWFHLLGNVLFLWIFADNIEATIGHQSFAIFYILSGVVASLCHVYFSLDINFLGDCCEPCNMIQPCYSENLKTCPGATPALGASGAISAVMGAYMVMFPKSKIKVLVLFLFRSFWISAALFLALWFVIQVYSSFNDSSNVAWWAHIGGFVFGVFAGMYFNQNYPTNLETDKAVKID